MIVLYRILPHIGYIHTHTTVIALIAAQPSLLTVFGSPAQDVGSDSDEEERFVDISSEDEDAEAPSEEKSKRRYDSKINSWSHQTATSSGTGVSVLLSCGRHIIPGAACQYFIKE